MKKKAIILALLFGQIYIWTGAIFMTILYHLFSFYDEVKVTYITEVFYYVMQAAGIFLYAMFLRGNYVFARKKHIITGLLALILACGLVAVSSADAISVLIFGAFMNFFIGCLTSAFLTRISTEVQTANRGLTFGLTYAVGSVGTYLISLPSGGTALTRSYIGYVYLAMTVLSIALCALFLRELDDRGEMMQDPETAGNDGSQAAEPQKGFDRTLVLIFLLPVLFLMINTLGYHFEQANVDQINIVFTRAFYAGGLLVAGFLNDRSRKTGAICALLALGFPLVSLALRYDPGFVLISSILSYLFLGFLSVYRAVLFADIAAESAKKTYLSTFGIAGGLLGNAIGTGLGLALEADQTALACTSLICYIVCGFLFFAVYNRLYATKTAPVEAEDERRKRYFLEYIKQYRFNAKQTEVLRLLLKGCSNAEIAEQLFLAESTVKYHVKNILRATGCKNRSELIEAYHAESK